MHKANIIIVPSGLLWALEEEDSNEPAICFTRLDAAIAAGKQLAVLRKCELIVCDDNGCRDLAA